MAAAMIATPAATQYFPFIRLFIGSASIAMPAEVYNHMCYRSFTSAYFLQAKIISDLLLLEVLSIAAILFCKRCRITFVANKIFS
jgi:hypothetical protein